MYEYVIYIIDVIDTFAISSSSFAHLALAHLALNCNTSWIKKLTKNNV